MMQAEPRWPQVVRQITDEIERLQHSLEVIQPEATTNQLRGEIRALRRLLSFGQPMAPVPPEQMIGPPPEQTR